MSSCCFEAEAWSDSRGNLSPSANEKIRSDQLQEWAWHRQRVKGESVSSPGLWRSCAVSMLLLRNLQGKSVTGIVRRNLRMPIFERKSTRMIRSSFRVRQDSLLRLRVYSSLPDWWSRIAYPDDSLDQAQTLSSHFHLTSFIASRPKQIHRYLTPEPKSWKPFLYFLYISRYFLGRSKEKREQGTSFEGTNPCGGGRLLIYFVAWMKNVSFLARAACPYVARGSKY